MTLRLGFAMICRLNARLLGVGGLALACSSWVGTAKDLTKAEGLAFFENRIRPIFVEHCYPCHSTEAKKVKGALKLDTQADFLKGGTDGTIVVAGHPEQSALIRAVRYEDPDFQMPPNKDGAKKLPEANIADLVRWVSMGAPYPETAQGTAPLASKSWAFAPIKNPRPPSVKKSKWPANSVDRFILAKIEANGGSPAEPADRHTLIRRATYDLTGLPPTPEEVDEFINDRSPAAFSQVVDRLLESRAYGEHWGRHWLDIVRYADTAGDTADYPVGLAWRYRNYVVDSFNADKPYDEFIREQIAGDILAERGPQARYAERVVATGFLAISRRFGFDSEKYHHLTLQDTLDTMGQTVLGLSLGCARCHDHKFDPISMQDYYALYGIFSSTRFPFPGSEQKPLMRSMVPLIPPQESQPAWREYDQQVAALSAGLKDRKGNVPGGVFRSLHDPDGDFETQKDAAGGSYGFIVPPWRSEGKVSVSMAAQSPFKNLYPLGKFGANVAGGEHDYHLTEALYPHPTRTNDRLLYVNIDFRVAAPDAAAMGAHRFWIGAQTGSPAVELLISSDAVSTFRRGRVEKLATVAPSQWHNLQLTLDLTQRTFTGTLGRTDGTQEISKNQFASKWAGNLDHVQWDSKARQNSALPSLEIDNFAAQFHLIPKVSTNGSIANADKGDIKVDSEKLTTLLINGPFEMAYGVVEGTPHDARLQMRGEPDRPGEESPRGFIKALGGRALPTGTRGSGRFELAQWLTRPENPLTARVMVNRLWQYHFGRGLVSTPNDFGIRGQEPTHPELLDYLATQFRRSGWSMKAMHRLLMLSATYQQSSPRLEGNSTSHDYSSFERRRLGAEELRDAMLAISHELKPGPGREHAFPSPVTATFSQHGPFSAVYEHQQRSIYLMTQRIKRHPFLALFDGPDPNATTADRRPTTVPTQALYFLNSPFVHEMAAKCATHLRANQPNDVQRVNQAWRLTTGRSPSPTEQSEAAVFLAAYRAELTAAGQVDPEAGALAAYVRSLFGSNEFLHLD